VPEAVCAQGPDVGGVDKNCSRKATRVSKEDNLSSTASCDVAKADDALNANAHNNDFFIGGLFRREVMIFRIHYFIIICGRCVATKNMISGSIQTLNLLLVLSTAHNI
jgi:hypothetical protein